MRCLLLEGTNIVNLGLQFEKAATQYAIECKLSEEIVDPDTIQNGLENAPDQLERELARLNPNHEVQIILRASPHSTTVPIRGLHVRVCCTKGDFSLITCCFSPRILVELFLFLALSSARHEHMQRPLPSRFNANVRSSTHTHTHTHTVYTRLWASEGDWNRVGLWSSNVTCPV